MKRKAILKTDVTAYNFQVRGKKGDVVWIRFKHDDVYIIENDKGNKYSVHKDKLELDGVSERDSAVEGEDATLD